jgi:putative spermidine/putrescine transport system substrate-binding protein
MTKTIPLNRRSVLAGGVALAGAAMLPHGAAAQAGKSIKVATWGGSWRDSLDKVIGTPLRAAGGTVDYVVDTPQGNLAKLVAARGGAVPFDNMESGLELVQLMAADRFIEDLNYDKIPNAKLLPKFAVAKNYVMCVASLDGIVYNHDKFKELGIPAPQQYQDLAHPKLQGRVAFPDINHTQHWNAVAGLAYDAGATEANLEAGIPLLNKIKPAYFYSASTDLSTKMASGEIWAAPWHAGFVVRLRRNKVPLSIAYPKIGTRKGALWPVIHHIVRGTGSRDMAEKFLDLYLAPELQFEHAKATGVMPINQAALKRLGDDPENKGVLLFEQQEIENLLVVDFTKVNLPRWRNAWNKDVSRG